MDMRIYLSLSRWKHNYWLIAKGKPTTAIPKALSVIKKVKEADNDGKKERQ